MTDERDARAAAGLRIVLNIIKAEHGLATDEQAVDRLLFELSPDGQRERVATVLRNLLATPS